MALKVATDSNIQSVTEMTAKNEKFSVLPLCVKFFSVFKKIP